MTDIDLLALIPHRPPMLLLSRGIAVTERSACAEVDIDAHAAFLVPGRGVPGWIGVEYMGQTAALIAGFQQQHGQMAPHLGMLLGTRRYTTNAAWFEEGTTWRVTCEEVAVVGQQLATFQCEIQNRSTGIHAASARLSVFRRPLQD